jgi:uncharacterized protein YjgD (DUF1641 family)
MKLTKFIKDKLMKYMSLLSALSINGLLDIFTSVSQRNAQRIESKTCLTAVKIFKNLQ